MSTRYGACGHCGIVHLCQVVCLPAAALVVIISEVSVLPFLCFKLLKYTLLEAELEAVGSTKKAACFVCLSEKH